MNWNQKLKEWESGIPQTYPKETIVRRFMYETSVCDNALSNRYEEEFIEEPDLFGLRQRYSDFKEHLDNPTNVNPYAVSFFNPSGNTLLIIPRPIYHKNFTTMKDFCDNAPFEYQVEFWKFAAENVRYITSIWPTVYVNTHGLGVPYFHLRLDKFPKYLKTRRFI